MPGMFPWEEYGELGWLPWPEYSGTLLCLTFCACCCCCCSASQDVADREQNSLIHGNLLNHH